MKPSPLKYASHLIKIQAVFTCLNNRQIGKIDPNVVLVCGPSSGRWNFTGRLFQNHPASPCRHLFRFYMRCREPADLWYMAPRCMCHSFAHTGPFTVWNWHLNTSHIHPEELSFCHTHHINWRLWHILVSSLKGRDKFSFLLFVTHFLALIGSRYTSLNCACIYNLSAQPG